MLKVNQLSGFGAGRGQRVNAVQYTAASSQRLDRASGSFAGGPNTGEGLLSIWFKPNSVASARNLFAFTDTSFSWLTLYMAAGGGISLDLYKNAGVNNYSWFSSTGVIDTNWHHLLIRFNTNASAGSRTMQVYLNDSPLSVTQTDIGSAFTLDFSSLTTGPATQSIAYGPSAYWDGAIAELFIAPGQSLDLSVASNRERFISGGKPAFLGNDGSAPTGTAPLIYLPNPAATVNVNAGTGGNFTINGSPADASSSPSD
jgi:hypothetical protein